MAKELSPEAIELMAELDIVVGVPNIAPLVKRSERATYEMLERGILPGFKLNGKWQLRPRRLVQTYEELEAAHQASAKAAQ